MIIIEMIGLAVIFGALTLLLMIVKHKLTRLIKDKF